MRLQTASSVQIQNQRFWISHNPDVKILSNSTKLLKASHENTEQALAKYESDNARRFSEWVYSQIITGVAPQFANKWKNGKWYHEVIKFV